MQSSLQRYQHVSTPCLRTARSYSSFRHDWKAFASREPMQTAKMALPQLHIQGPLKDMGRAPPSLAELEQLLASSMEVLCV